MNINYWQPIALLLLGGFIGGAPTHFLAIHERPTVEAVEKMITNLAPRSMDESISSIKDLQTKLEIKIERLTILLESISSQIERSD